ncbi:TetR/AcrR family transcriptional regulator [Lentzea sp. DG1S-22]|uniref:TetR/AcrR family transcriptional regulator n=1 Tax=Lentzea sp. DG1S-22 TaxID=3108822 RepID=UPI002E79298E|nr:TetR/AcrR family transcriptional regulator [Lentzea sp. DG1S-22]WVH82587.1 TetR/AcrR family transcriptional regulator [Lentzea sp. DG1S-22]
MTPQRKDAARNWEHILTVARELVDEGTPLQLNDVARRAGLGVGTVYRHFPTTEALLETVAAPRLEALADHGEKSLDHDDPWTAFADYLTELVEGQVTDPALAKVSATAHDVLPRTTELKTRILTAGAQLLARAREAGALRPGLDDADLVPLMCGISYATYVHSDSPADRLPTARRYLDTLLRGLRA